MSNTNQAIDDLKEQLDGLLTAGGIQRVYTAGKKLAVPGDANFSHVDRLAVPLSGCHRMDVPDDTTIQQISPRPHQATWIPKGAWNRPDWQLPVEVATFMFESDCIRVSFVRTPGNGLDEKRVARFQLSRLDSDGNLILGMLKRRLKENPTAPRGCPLAEVLIHHCLDALRRGNAKVEGKAYRTYRTICDYLEENYSSGLTRESVARTFNITPNYLSNLFKKSSGESFNHSLNGLRIRRARHLLSHFRQPLDHIAFSCGFADTSYFCRVFRQHTGTTPGAFEKSNCLKSMRAEPS
jgi:AraC-like DNA-binding protein